MLNPVQGINRQWLGTIIFCYGKISSLDIVKANIPLVIAWLYFNEFLLLLIKIIYSWCVHCHIIKPIILWCCSIRNAFKWDDQYYLWMLAGEVNIRLGLELHLQKMQCRIFIERLRSFRCYYTSDYSSNKQYPTAVIKLSQLPWV